MFFILQRVLRKPEPFIKHTETMWGKLYLYQFSLPDCAYYWALPWSFSVSLSLWALQFTQQNLSHIDSMHFMAQKSVIRSLGFCKHYGRRWTIDCCKRANWKTLPIRDNWSSFGRDAAGKLETIPHLVIGPEAIVSTVCCSCNQETLGNLYVVITNSCNHCEIEHLLSL